MSLDDRIAADQAAVTAAQTALDAATAQLKADTDAKAAIQPHLALLDQMLLDLDAAEQGASANVQAAYDGLKGSVASGIQQLKALFSA